MATERALTAAIGEAVEAGGGIEPELDLFAEPATEAGRKKLGAVVLRGPGRPLGAKNKRTIRSVDQLLGTYLDPRAKALWIIQQHPADLAALWHCTIFEAAQEQRLYLLGVIGFVAAKITPDVIDNRQVIHLHFGGGSDGTGEAGAGAVHVLDPDQFERIEAPDAEKPSAPDDGNSET